MVFAVGAAISAPLYDPDKPIAIIYKPVGTVDFMKEGKNWTKAATATPLTTGDRVKTGDNSFVIVKFIENSILRLQEKSEITIRGELSANKEFSKNVHLERGQLGFDVKKQVNEKFEFSTPTSVASIRGTEGLLINGGDSADVLILGMGVVVFTNNVSNQSVNVNGGQTAYSYANGTIQVKQTTPEELKKLQETSGSGGGGGTGGSSGTSSSGSFSVGFAVTSTVVTEGKDFEVTVELVQTSVPVDTLKSIVSYFALAYKNSAAAGYKEVPATISGAKVKFKIPGADVVSPSMQIYIIFRTKTGIDMTYPPTTPQSNPIVIPVQSTKSNQLKLEFSDPSGKRKTMIIEY
jgi:sorbitol-specific phosphotransferase system component IIA